MAAAPQAEVVGEIGFSNEGGGAIHVGVERYGLDILTGLCVEVPNCVDQPHGGFTPVDYGDTAKHSVSLRRAI